MDTSLKKIKISFSAFVLLLVIGMAGGSFAVKDSGFYIKEQISQTVSYLNYRSSFAYANNGNLTAAVVSIFDSADPVTINNGNAKSVPALLYHRIIDEPDGVNILLENFKNQMLALKKAGWQTVSIEDFYVFMKGEKELPDKSFLLTFDDGAKDSYYPVDPILKALNYKAVTFIITEYSVGKGSGSNYYLSSAELQRMKKGGRWDIQSHGEDDHTFYKIDDDGNEGHFLSNKLWLEDKQRIETEKEFKSRIYNNFINSKNALENEFGVTVAGFAYPFGDFGNASINFPKSKFVILDTIKSVYPMSFYQVWGDNFAGNYPQPNAEHLFAKRINVKPEWNAGDLLAVIERSDVEDQENSYDLLSVLQNSREKTLPYYDDFTKNLGWKKTWGNVDFSDGFMTIESHASTTGSTVFLNNAYLWQDYKFKADVSLTKGQTFSLIARYKDGKNYTTCAFSEKSIRVEQLIDGEKEILSELKGDFSFTGVDRGVGIGIYDNTVNCYLDGKIAMKGYDLDERLDYGGVGFKTWDPQLNNSELIIKSVSVEEIK